MQSKLAHSSYRTSQVQARVKDWTCFHKQVKFKLIWTFKFNSDRVQNKIAFEPSLSLNFTNQSWNWAKRNFSSSILSWLPFKFSSYWIQPYIKTTKHEDKSYLQEINGSPETRKKGICEHLSTKNVAGPNAGDKRLRQKNTAWATPWPNPPAAWTIEMTSVPKYCKIMFPIF